MGIFQGSISRGMEFSWEAFFGRYTVRGGKIPEGTYRVAAFGIDSLVRPRE